MTNHKITYLQIGTKPPVRHTARCLCGWAPVTTYVSKWDVEDQVIKHGIDVNRMRAWLGTRTPSLKQQRDFYQSKADDQTVPGPERVLWQQLADELSARLGHNAPTWDEETLPF